MSRGECLSCSAVGWSMGQGEGGEVVGGVVLPGTRRLLPGSRPQFLSPSPQGGPLEAEEEEPGEQDGGGVREGRAPPQLLVFQGLLGTSGGLMPNFWPQPLWDSSLSPLIHHSHQPQSFPRGMGAAGCLGLDPRCLGSLRLGYPPLACLNPPALSHPRPLLVSIPWEFVTFSLSLPTAQLQHQQKLSLDIGVRGTVVHAMQEVLWSR